MEIKHNKNGNFAEENQPYKVLFAWGKKEDDQWQTQHTYVKCRDFLGDLIVLKKENNTTKDLYGLTLPVDFKLTDKLIVNFPKKEYNALFVSNIKHLYEIENKNNIKNTEIVFNNNKELVIKVPKFWMQSNVTLSLYTLLIKIFSHSKEKHFDNADPSAAMYLMSMGNYLPKLLDNLKKIEFPKIYQQYLDKNKDLGLFHFHSGVVSSLKPKAVSTVKTQLDAL